MCCLKQPSSRHFWIKQIIQTHVNLVSGLVLELNQACLLWLITFISRNPRCEQPSGWHHSLSRFWYCQQYPSGSPWRLGNWWHHIPLILTGGLIPQGDAWVLMFYTMAFMLSSSRWLSFVSPAILHKTLGRSHQIVVEMPLASIYTHFCFAISSNPDKTAKILNQCLEWIMGSNKMKTISEKGETWFLCNLLTHGDGIQVTLDKAALPLKDQAPTLEESLYTIFLMVAQVLSVVQNVICLHCLVCQVWVLEKDDLFAETHTLEASRLGY